MIEKISLQHNYSTKPLSVQNKKEDTQNNSAPKEQTQNYATPSSVNFQGWFSNIGFNKGLKTPDDKVMYEELKSSLDFKGQNELEKLKKSGKLMDKSSNDESTTLKNLYKIIKTPRAQGLSTKNILLSTIETLNNPFIITQTFGDIPPEEANRIINKNSDNQKLMPQDMNVEASGTCVAASMEFNLASKRPAEFARFVEGLSSEKGEVKSTIDAKNIATNTSSTIEYLNEFEVPYKILNWDKIQVTLRPDKDALSRAQVQTTHHDPGERSAIDTLLQSTFMEIGSEGTYNSLTDKRYGKFNSNEKGLTEFEKNVAEEIVFNKQKTSVIYQIVDNEARLTGYATDLETTKKHLLDSLANGNNIIIGITETDETGAIISGHEITVIGTQKDKNGQLLFICNDTDDNYDAPIVISEKDLLPKIHHAGIPTNVLPQEIFDVGTQVLEEYNDLKSGQAANIA